MYDKETIYDEQIFPLMDKIINICKENDIQILSSFYLKTDGDGNLLCTTYLESKEQNASELQNAVRVIKNGYVVEKPYFMATTITSTK